MKNILLITESFPPVGRTGSQRMLSLCQHLPDRGWNVDVITRELTGRETIDKDLKDAVPDEIRIYRTPLPQTSKGVLFLQSRNFHLLACLLDLLTFPCSQLALPTLFGFWKGLETRRKRNQEYDVILSSFPGWFPLFLGWLLSNYWKVPLVSDLRDPWTEDLFYDPNSLIHHQFQCWLQSTVLSSSEAIITTNQHYSKFLHKKHQVQEEKIFSIPHGFDNYSGNVIDQLDDKSTCSSEKAPSDYWQIISAGSFYESRSLDPVLRSLRRLINQGKIPTEHVRFTIVGKSWQDYSFWIENYDWVRKTGFLPRLRQVREKIMCADLCVTVLNKGKNRILGRLQEYIGAGKPILLCALRDSASAQLVRESGLGEVVEPNQESALEQKLLSFYDNWSRNKQEKKPDESFVRALRRRRLVKNFAGVFQGVVNQNTEEIDIEEVI